MEELVDIVLLAGEVLLTNGAEIQRVEETIERMGRAAGFSDVEVFATPTGLFVSLYTPQGQVYSRVRRIRRVDNHLEKIALVNSLSRAYSKGEIAYWEVKQSLLELTQPTPHYSPAEILASGAGCGAFALLFGGSFIDALLAGVIGVILAVVSNWMGRYPFPRVLLAAVGGGLAALCARVFGLLFPTDISRVILGGVMVLVPGVVMTTALRDMLSGELVSGVSRGADALATAVAVAAGVAAVLSMGV